jgi:iron(III) transport system substrate-binding protein
MARTRSLIAALAALTVLTGSVGACGGDNKEAEGSGDAAGAAIPENAPQEVKDAAAAAEERGLKFYASHDEIVECAKKEGSVTIQTSSDDFEPLKEGFEKQYPFVKSEFVVLSGAATERFLLEAESGSGPNYDVGYPAPEAYNEISDMFGYDIAGMAQAGVLDIPEATIDENNHTVVSAGSSGIALAYNRDKIPEAELPKTWDGVADPKFARDQLGMAMDVDLNNVSVLSLDPDWGIDKVVDLSTKMRELNPVFTDGHTAASLLVQSGEVAISPFVNLHSLMREIDKNPDGPLQVAFIEPVPIRESEASGVMRDAEHPCGALLYIEWTAGDTAQKIFDEDGPIQASFAWDGSRMKQMVGDRKTVIAGPDQIAELPDAISKIQEAFGFPTLP